MKFRELLIVDYKEKIKEIDEKIKYNQHDWGLVGLLESERIHYTNKINRLEKSLKWF